MSSFKGFTGPYADLTEEASTLYKEAEAGDGEADVRKELLQATMELLRTWENADE